MSNTVEAVKELLSKVPNIQELIQEATKPVERTWAETAYIYNGYGDITIKYAGVTYELKFNEVTPIKGRMNHREVDQFSSKDGSVKFIPTPLPGERIAREMIDGRGLKDRGFLVLTTPTISAEDREECLRKGEDSALQRIESYKIGRDRVKAGQAGKNRPDPRTYGFMKKYAPDDEIFARQNRQTVAQTNMAEALVQLAASNKLVAELQERIIRLESEREAGTVIQVPRRKPLESDEQYTARVAQWKKEKGLE